MSERLIRLERLIAVLNDRGVAPISRARYLTDRVGEGKQSYWSNLLSGDKSFGDKAARKIEKALCLAPFSLEENGFPPDAATVAATFDQLPLDTDEARDRRRQLYVSIIAMIRAHLPPDSNTP